MSDVGISNLEIKRISKNCSNDDLKNTFVGVFASGQINYFFNLHKLITEKKTDPRYPFVIANTDRSGQSGTHWWNILDFHSKKEIFFFDKFGILKLKNFIIQGDQKITEKSLVGI